MKKLASLPARSQVCGVKPEEPSCSRRRVGVLPSLMWTLTTGSLVPTPIWPPLLDVEGVVARAGLDAERVVAGGGVFDREVVEAAVGGVVADQAPVVVGEAGGGGGVVEVDAQVVLFQAQGVGAEVLTVCAVEADAGGALDDDVVGEDLVLARLEGEGVDGRAAGDGEGRRRRTRPWRRCRRGRRGATPFMVICQV